MGEEEFASKAKNYEFMDEEARKERNAKLDEELAELAKIRREKLDEQTRELEELKEKQAERRAEREKEMEEMAERLREVEERKKAEEDEKRAKLDEIRQRRLEEKKSKNESEIPKNETFFMSEEELKEAKGAYIEVQTSKYKIDGLGSDDLRNKIKDMWEVMVKLEGDKIDLETRQKEQEYDMKELEERESQKMRNRAAAMGVDPDEAAKCKYPPKVRLYSKNDRQVDHRSYKDRMEIWNQPASKKVYKVFHGSCRPPSEWKPKEYDELEKTFKGFEGFKYVELDPVEHPAHPAAVVPPTVPEKDAFEIKEVTPPPPPTGGLGPGTYNP